MSKIINPKDRQNNKMIIVGWINLKNRKNKIKINKNIKHLKMIRITKRIKIKMKIKIKINRTIQR